MKALRAAARFPVRIKCVAVWDTIGNLGIPFVRKGLIKELLAFHDTELPPTVDVGLHALVHRRAARALQPHALDLKKGASLPPGQIVEQVWFPGCHANIGGGYKDCALSDIALLWMAERLTQTTGLAVDLAAPARDHQARPPRRAGVADLGRHLPGELPAAVRAPDQAEPEGNIRLPAGHPGRVAHQRPRHRAKCRSTRASTPAPWRGSASACPSAAARGERDQIPTTEFGGRARRMNPAAPPRRCPGAGARPAAMRSADAILGTRHVIRIAAMHFTLRGKGACAERQRAC